MAEGSASLPAAPQRTPGLPENPDMLVFTGWGGIDTKPPRAGVADDKCSWLDNVMPLGENNMRALPDIALSALYTAPINTTIIHFDFFGLAPATAITGPSAIVFLSDGSAVAVNVFTSAQTTVAPAGTFNPPANTAIATRQFGVEYLLITTLQGRNAYWVWDGTLLYGAGTLGPEVTLTDDGTGYTSTPTITAVGGSGSGATFSSTVNAGAIEMVTVTGQGSGWTAQNPDRALLLFNGGGGGQSAYGTATVVNGAIVNAAILNGGIGYTGVPIINITDATGSGASVLVDGISGGVVTSLRVIECGSNYTAPSVSVSGGGGTGLTIDLILQSGVITGVTMNQIGSGYIEQPGVFFLSPTGSGASGTAVISQGTITGVDFGEGVGHGFTGAGYTGTVIVGFVGGGGPASGTVQLMPFGIQGNAIEVYQSRVWISTTHIKVKIFFSAPSSAVNFSPNDGGGVFPATDSVLRYQWGALIQSNGFLYLIGDSSVNYVSGVNTGGSPAITTFSNLNVDPQIGSPWRDSVVSYSRAVIMANPFGIHAIYGGAVQKISTPLDGVFGTRPTSDVLNNPSSAVAQVFGVHVYMLLAPIIDPITGGSRNILFMWDGKRWWTAGGGLVKIASEEWGSTLNAYGTDGFSLFQLFAHPSINITKTIQSKLWMRPAVNVQKKAQQMYAFFEATKVTTLNFTADTESGSTAITQGAFAASAGTTTFARSNAGDALGYSMGFTMTSNSVDFTIINMSMLIQQRRLKV